jgi:hypothetical protein
VKALLSAETAHRNAISELRMVELYLQPPYVFMAKQKDILTFFNYFEIVAAIKHIVFSVCLSID